MNLKDRQILEQFRKERPDFVALGDLVHEMLNQLVKDANEDLKLVHVNDAVMEVLDITGFADILNIE